MNTIEQQIKERMGRKRSFLDTSPKIIGISDMLETCKESLSYTELREKCRISHKGTFLKYLKFCTEKGLIEHSKVTKAEPASRFSFYITSQKGREFMGCIS